MENVPDNLFWSQFQVAYEDFLAGRLSFARLRLEDLLKINPECEEVVGLLGIVFAQQGEAERAQVLFEKAISLNPQNFSYYANLGNVLCDLGRPEKAKEQQQKALSINPDFAEAHYGLGNAQQKMAQYAEAILSYDCAIAIRPDWPEPLINKGNTYELMTQDDAALACYNLALQKQPGHAAALLNIGKIYLKRKKPDAALESFRSAIKCNPSLYDAYAEAANLLIQLVRFDEARAYCEQAIQLSPRNSRAYFLMGISYFKARDLNRAIEFTNKAIDLEVNPEAKANFYNTLGACYMKALERKKSEEAFLEAVALNPNHWSAYSNLGDLYYTNAQLDLAYEAYSKITPKLQPCGLMHYIKCLWCDWSEYQLITERFLDCLPYERVGGSMEDPWHLQRISDSAALAYSVATNYKKSTKNYEENFLGVIPKHPQKSKIKVGFFSPDFKEHPVAHLLLGVLKNLNREKFEIIAFSFGVVGQHDTIRPQLLKIFDEFVNINLLHEVDVAKKAREQGIDIAIDLTGITSENRCAIFGYRPAPIQVNYLGFMGTIGDDTEDYIIADAVVIPPELKKYYYEKVVSLPAFMPFDDKVGDEKKSVTRSEAGLPEHGFIFACFNPGVKITPMVYDSWMRILKAVPNSYLWLSPRNNLAEVNLRKEATRRGVSEERIIFAPKVRDMQFHLSRQQHINLFLDTYPYNAHTTAADALWAGAVLLTRKGESMPSRVAASLLTALDLPELITSNPDEYEAKAIDLAMHPEKLAVLKAKLAQNRLTSPLFNTKLYTKHFEAALTAMYERYQAGLPPDHIEIKA